MIIQVLSHLDVPVERLNYTGLSQTYITFAEIGQSGLYGADDEEAATGSSYQLDIYSTENFLELVKQVKIAMKEAGFGNRTYETETFVPKTRQYHKTLRFSYTKR